MFEHLVKMGKGTVTTAHSAISATATSSAINVNFHNAALVAVDFTGSGSWTVKLQGALTSDGVYKDLYDNNGSLLSTGSISADRIQLFVGLPENIKVVATEDSGTASITVKVQPITI